MASHKQPYNPNLDQLVRRADLTDAAARKTVVTSERTVADTGNTDFYITVPETGILDSLEFVGIDALATSDTNYITFSATNLGQAGAGTTVMLAASNANTTKATGGSALAANTKRSLTLNATVANLAVTQGDRIRVRCAVTGTLAAAVTGAQVTARFNGTN